MFLPPLTTADDPLMAVPRGGPGYHVSGAARVVSSASIKASPVKYDALQGFGFINVSCYYLGRKISLT